MAIAQFTLLGTQCQWLIARCVLDSELLAPYLSHGKILFKGSSTVSCLTTMLSGTPMRICGRISKNGMKRSKAVSQGAHFLLYEHGEIQNVDSCLEHTLQTMGPGDLFVTGANALDAFGHAALLIGSPRRRRLRNLYAIPLYGRVPHLGPVQCYEADPRRSVRAEHARLQKQV